MTKEDDLKPIYNPDTGSYLCGNCKRRLRDAHKTSMIYCPKCGWKIGWNMITEIQRKDKDIDTMTMTFYINSDLTLGWK